MTSRVRFTVPYLLAVLLASAACDGGTFPGPAPTSVSDSLAARARGGWSGAARFSATGVAVAPLRAGDRAVVTVTGVGTTRCERVAAAGAIAAVAFDSVGTCGGSESFGLGAQAALGPAPADGTLRLYLPLALGGAGLARVSGTYPDFRVAMDDGLFDGDFDDVVVSVRVVEGPRLRLRCTDRVTRGGLAWCTAAVTDTAAALEVMEWSFAGGGHTVTMPSTGVSWSGPMAVGGVAAVRARVNGREWTARDTIHVAPRVWKDLVPSPTEAVVGCDERTEDCPLLHPPADLRDLGVTRVERAWNVSGRVTRIAVGPNRGWSYVSGRGPVVSFPSRVRYLSPVLVDGADAFWAANPQCPRDALLAWQHAHQDRHGALLDASAAAGRVNAGAEAFARFGTAAEAEGALRELLAASVDGWVREALDAEHEMGGYPALPCAPNLAHSEDG